MKRRSSRSKSSTRRHATEGLAVTTTLLCAAGNLAAQNAAPAPTAPTNATTLPPVVVEGSQDKVYKPERVESPKIQGPLRDVPQTITVIPEAVIKEQNATSLRDVLRNVPGISIQAGEGGGGPAGDNLSIRGFNAKTDIFVDNVRDFGGYTRDPFNFQQVEVFKGPSSTNAGRGSTGGSINLVSKAAQLQPFYAADVGGGTDNYFRATLDVNQPLWTNQAPGTPLPAPVSGKGVVNVSGKGAKSVAPVAPGPETGAALRLNGLYHHADIPGRDYVEDERWGLAGSLVFGLGTDTRLTLNYFHLEQDNQPDYGIPWVPDTVTSLSKYANKAAPVPFHNYYGLTDRDYEEISTDIGTAIFEHDFSDNLRLRSLFRVGRTTRDSIISAPRFAGTGTTLNHQLQSRDQEDTIYSNQTDITAEFETGALRHTLTGGFELTREESENRARASTVTPQSDLFHPNPTQNFTGRIYHTGAYSAADVDSAALYLFDKVAIGDHWEVNGGLRWDYLETDFTDGHADGGSDHYNRDDSLLSWRAALVYKPAENGSIYFAYGTSFNPATELLVSSSASAVVNQFNTDPEENRSYEVGTKWDILDEKVSFTAALFRTEKTNARTADPADPTNFELSGEQVVQGAEFGINGNITDSWRVFAGYTYLDSEIEASANADEVGNHVPNTPEHSFNLWTVYDLPYGFQIGAGAQYVGSRFNNNLNQREAPDYWTFDAMLGYQVNENIAIRLNVYNLADEDYIDRVGGGHFVPGPGRSAVVSLNVKF
ncbi:TonB-dependent siderophore receptor [Roseimicrobium sp. ORNL1]|uniref:TonB-dependent receptor n=1 Tax=Roseimicrobium sp. ORNL1 TaxID=2711231 RepID=UPI0013E1815D|nr:TonB-dependent siderophore receptor [Roseimicrobium sp. ORNL1]QIF02396.1 TonB-dependent siderophore receptor [Roseimicrobium sp. ORNL1]